MFGPRAMRALASDHQPLRFKTRDDRRLSLSPALVILAMEEHADGGTVLHLQMGSFLEVEIGGGTELIRYHVKETIEEIETMLAARREEARKRQDEIQKAMRDAGGGTPDYRALGA